MPYNLWRHGQPDSQCTCLQSLSLAGTLYCVLGQGALLSQCLSPPSRGFIKGWAPSKLIGYERDLAINLPGCFRLLFLLPFIRKTKNAQLKNPTDLLHKNLMKPLTQEYIRVSEYLTLAVIRRGDLEIHARVLLVASC